MLIFAFSIVDTTYHFKTLTKKEEMLILINDPLDPQIDVKTVSNIILPVFLSKTGKVAKFVLQIRSHSSKDCC